MSGQQGRDCVTDSLTVVHPVQIIDGATHGGRRTAVALQSQSTRQKHCDCPTLALALTGTPTGHAQQITCDGVVIWPRLGGEHSHLPTNDTTELYGESWVGTATVDPFVSQLSVWHPVGASADMIVNTQQGSEAQRCGNRAQHVLARSYQACIIDFAWT